ncbi:hypothetical protein [Pseudobacteroides cellulosolvens]|uniref:Uncharacterized protein n=1 Tax=Pseudobacteroides cellulosolvens ATCC 35603 = DSM 2933 TaxID=398512 RepID=A0A0L6JVA9_9FIRM|nr:hypothetical protein [Pseudobacteroides cellulosolvens]KNY29585.1 hypothetical protein Bccel_4859 [Pseudobacteroides cellulosolvens ATCC 35603 = DSM 2933]
MNKKLVRTGIGLVVGGSLLITSTFMSIADGPSGYDTLKAAFRNSRNIENATFTVSGSVSDNSKDMVKISSTFKADEEEHLYSGTIAINSDKVNKSYTLYGSKNQVVFKDTASNVYNKLECNDEYEGKRHQSRRHNNVHENPQLEAIGEKIMDTLVGDLKKQVTLKEMDNGEKQIGIDLDKDEIPSLVNLLLAVKEDKSHEADKQDKIHEIFGVNTDDCTMPELANDIKAEKVDVKITVDKDNTIKGLDVEFGVSGKDEANIVHEQEMKLSMTVSEVGSTKVDTVSLEGKTVKEISSDEFDCHKR